MYERHGWSRAPLWLSILSLLLAGACSRGGVRQAAESTAVPRFHARYDARDFGSIYNDATEQFRSATPRAEYDKFMSAVRQKLGPVRSSERQQWNLKMGTDGTQVVLTYATEFEKGKGTETFTFRGTDDGPKLVGYQINSNQLITN